MLKTKIALAAAALTALTVGSTAANAATATATAKAKILGQITVTKTADLDFGTVVVGATGGTVAVDSAGARTCATALLCSGTSTAARFTVSGTNGQVVTVASDSSVSLTSGSNNMSASLSPSVSSMTLAGSDSFNVGGTLTVPANQAAGNYSGTFAVTVNYQ